MLELYIQILGIALGLIMIACGGVIMINAFNEGRSHD